MSRPAFNRSTDGWFLLQSGLTDKTVADYKRDVRKFIDWCRATNVAFSTIITADHLDDLITDYLHYRYELMDGGGRQGGENLVNGIHMLLPRLKGKLLTARRVLLNWKRVVPPDSYLPLTWELAVAIAVQMSHRGYYRYAVGLLLSFHCLLRVSEMSAINTTHIVDHADDRFPADYRKMMVTIPFAKGGRYQSVSVDDPAIIRLIRILVNRTAAGKPLFPGGVHSYRRVFNSVRDELALSSKYGTHSLRHGGATLLFLRGVSIENILIRGRWKSNSSARTYIQQSPAVLAAVTAPAAIVRAARVLAKDVVLSLSLAQSHSS